MTVGVYGLVAGIVKLDDAGLYLSQRKGDTVFPALLRGLGAAILAMAPYLMKALSIAGTAAMFLVGGGILLHGIPGAEHYIGELMGLARSEEHTSELQSLMRISYAVFCLKKKTTQDNSTKYYT